MSTYYPILVLTLIFGFIAFYTFYRLSVSGVQVYEKNFVRQIGGGLRNAFIFMNVRQLFIVNLIAIVVVGGLLALLINPVAGLIAAVVLVFVPNLIIRLIRKKRNDKFIYQLPDALSSMASSLRAGTNLSRAMELVSNEHPAPISQEFSLVLSEYKMGRSFEVAFMDMCRRIGKAEVELLNSAITISRQVGGNLAETLDSLAKTLREKAQVEGKINALTAMGRMQGWVVGLLPIAVGLMVYRTDPENMSKLFTEVYGWIVLVIISVMLVIAMMMIRKIVNIDI